MKKRIMTIVVMCAVLMMSFATMVSADDPVDVTTTLTSSFQTVVDNIMTTIGGILPVALGLLGLSMAIMFGIKWFKKIAGKA